MKRKKVKQTREKIYIAAVLIDNGNLMSLRPEGDFSAFLGKTQAQATEKALGAMNKWSIRGNRLGPYAVFVGTLNYKVQEKRQYQIEAIQPGGFHTND